MPEYRVLRGTYRRSDGTVAEPGDTVTADESFVDRFPDSKFDRVHADDTGGPDDDSDGSTDTADTDDTADDGDDGAAAEPPDVNEWQDWNEDDWLALGYEQRAKDVRNGAVDARLDRIESVDRSNTVLDAVEARRDELEG